MPRTDPSDLGALARRAARAAAVLLLFAAAHGRAQGPAPAAPPPDPSRLFREAAPVGDADVPDAFEFEIDGYGYRVARNGAGRRVRGEQTRLFNLRLEDLGEVRRVEFMEYEGNVLLLCTLDYGDGLGGFVYRLEQPSMRAAWSRDVPAVNIRAVREGGALYLAGYGFIGKLDLRTGLYLWQRGEVVARGKSAVPQSDFERPAVSGDVVVVREASPAPGAAPRTLRVHKKSGHILGVEQ